MSAGVGEYVNFTSEEGQTPLQKVSWIGHWTTSDGNDTVLMFWLMLTIPSLTLLSALILLLVTVRVPFIVQLSTKDY